MKHLAAVLLLGGTLWAQTPSGPGAPERFPQPLPGGYHPIPKDDPMAKEAWRITQTYFKALSIVSVEEAYTQVVAGLNTRIVCLVKEPDGEARWAFIVYRKLDGRSRLQNAARLADAP